MMKTITPRLCAVIAALLLTFGFARAAEHFDPAIGEVSDCPETGASCSAPPCIDPPSRTL